MWLVLKTTALLLVMSGASHAMIIDSTPPADTPVFDSSAIDLRTFAKEDYLQEIVVLMRQGKQQEANLRIARILSKDPKDKAALELAGISLMMMQDFKAAEEAFARLVALPPVTADVIAKYGVTQLLNGNVKAGAKLLRQVVQHQPANALSNRYLGWLAARDNDPVLAIQHLERLPAPTATTLRDFHIELASNYKKVSAYQEIIDFLGPAVTANALGNNKLRIQAALHLALAHAGAGHSRQAQTWRAALEPYMANSPARRFQLELGLAEVTGDAGAARKAVSNFVSQRPAAEAYARFELAKVLLALGQNNEALEATQLALEGADETHTQHGLSLMIPILTTENRVDEALGALSTASARFPDNDAFRFALADLQATSGRFDAARQTLQHLLERPSAYPPAILLAGRLARAEHNHALALDLLNRYLKERPGDSTGWITKAGVYYDRNDMERAITTLKQGIEALPGEALLHYELGAMYQAAGDIPLANAQYEKALTLHANYLPAMESLASNFLDMNEYVQRAHELAQKLYAEMPDAPYIQDLWGWSLYRNGDLETARAILQAAAASITDSGRADYHLALALRDLGDDEEAVKHFRVALKKGVPLPLSAAAEAALEATR